MFDRKANRHKYYLAHKDLEIRRAIRRNWSPENRIRVNYSSTKASSKARDILFDLTLEEYTPLALLPCFYCGEALPRFGSGLDRIDSNKGYIITNVVPCCSYCNFGKNSQTQEDFLARCIRISDKHRSTCHLNNLTTSPLSNSSDADLR